MNRSFSKIRHIQESNMRLEKRLISEDDQFELAQKLKDYKDKLENL